MNREISKEIMDRSRLRNKFLKTKSEADKKNYVKQRNYCVSLLRRTKKEYYGSLAFMENCGLLQNILENN